MSCRLRVGSESAPSRLQVGCGGAFGVAHAGDVGVSLVLCMSTLDADRLRQAGLTLSERANCLHFRDPDGHHLQLVDPGQPHHSG